MVMVKTCAKVATVGTALVLGGLLVACTDTGTPSPASTSATTTTSSTAPTTTTTAPSTSRNLALPPGVGPFPSSVCVANIQSHGLVNGLYNAYSSAKANQPIGDDDWQSMQTVIPDFINRATPQRGMLEQAGVPATHPVYQDTDEVLAAMNALLDISKAKDSSKIVAAYQRLQTADQRIIESCGAITRH